MLHAVTDATSPDEEPSVLREREAKERERQRELELEAERQKESRAASSQGSQSCKLGKKANNGTTNGDIDMRDAKTASLVRSRNCDFN